jgi:class 3 adenylate cyclase/tetratricopeptide (TPR) repeat protein
MRCTKCGSENPDSKRFCGDCGSPFGNCCARCGAENPAGKKFCGDCGADLSQPTAAPQSAEPAAAPVVVESGEPPEVPKGERRHLTVLFCDLVGSTEIAGRLDPEEWREIVGEYHRAAAHAIERFGGHVAQYLGDGVMAYFGWPEAHDNDAERAARAGLAILDALSKLNEQPTHPKLAARVGIDSGAVVVGAGAGKDTDVFGDTPNIAARVQTAAAPGTVLIGADTHRLVSGLFVVEDRGAQALKGIDRPVQLYRVVQPSGVRGRLEAGAAAQGLTPFVGREDELRLLMNRWEHALEGEGQVALIIGEAGIGKSRLVQRFHEQIAATPHTWVEATAGAFFQNTPFYPVTELLRELLAWRRDESADEQLTRLESALELAGLKPAEALPLIAPLLNLPMPAKYPPSPLSPEQQRRRLLATLVEWALGAARAQPTVIAIEDLHWADPSTLELLQLLVEQGATARLLLLYTARPEFHTPWPLRTHHTQITLNRLSTRNVRTMVGEVAAQKALSEETIATVLERTGGVPLFVEELTRAVLESDDAKLTGRQIPVTLHDSLMARLDRLGSAKEVAQVGAVIGTEFSYELLHAVHPLAEEDLHGALRKLADAELIYVHGIPPEANYSFKHALVRDAAYEALLRSRRKDLHRLVARTIDEKFPALKELHPEILARHWTEAGEPEPAIAEWSRAGDAAQARNAFREAQESYQQALALLDLLPESSERDIRELELRQSVVQTLYVQKGYAAPETVAATERAAALAEKSGNFVHLVNWATSRSLNALVSGALSAAGEILDQTLEFALRQGATIDLGSVHQLQTITRYRRGDLIGAEKHFTEWLTLSGDPRFKQSPRVAVNALAFGSHSAWLLGRADVAREREGQMMTAANRGNPFDVANSEYCAAFLHVDMREYEQAETLAAHALQLAEKHQFPNPAVRSRVALGQARAQLGRVAEGIALIRQGIAGLREIGTRMGISSTTAWLAEAQEREGAIGDALETVERALQANPEELVHRPEALRLRGELRLKQGQTELAEADFREAIALAQRMGAKAWELRATTSLARLLDEQGRRDEAHAMLAEIYGWFTEGFDTVDLKDAKTLLDELSS